jgi:hypothetical protein
VDANAKLLSRFYVSWQVLAVPIEVEQLSIVTVFVKMDAEPRPSFS